MRCCLFFLVWMFAAGAVSAQRYTNDPAVNDSLLNLVVKKHIALNKAKNSIPGYRVQIYFGAQRAKAMEMRNDFLKTYPEIGSYIIYQQPYFKVRVGDYKTRLEAMKFLKQIQSFYETSFIVKEDIHLPDLQ